MSKKEEERNEKIIRGLMKLPPNRRCINCNTLGPGYVCTNFWTFVCTTCSGIHREFTHRVKSVSMAKFTSQEVESLQRGGNQRARELFLKDWDHQRQRLPDSSNVDRVREFIKNAYVDRKYAGGKNSDKPPRDAQSPRNLEDETRRASSYHSYSQSPPYEYQYEDRKYGRQVGALSRKPGSDRGYYEGKISSFVYSPGRVHEERFANDGSDSRVSDFSVSSTSDPFRSDNQSPNFQNNLISPSLHPVKDILVEDTRPQTRGAYSDLNIAKGDFSGVRSAQFSQRIASSGSFGSFDSNSMTSGSLVDVVSEPEQSAGTQLGRMAPVSSKQSSSVSASAVEIDLFSVQFLQQSGASSIDLFEKSTTSSAPSQDDDIEKSTVVPSIDFFADISHQNPVAASLEQKPQARSLPENKGWATFDLPQYEASTIATKYVPHTHIPTADVVSSLDSSMQWPSVNYTSPWPFPSVDNQWHGGLHEVQVLSGPTSTTGGLPSNATDQKSTNPFDLPYDSDLEPNSVLLNMNSLQAALPESQLPPSYIEDFNQPWFPSNTIPPYVQAAPQGGLAYVTGEAPTPQFPNISSQGSVASLGGNPFA